LINSLSNLRGLPRTSEVPCIGKLRGRGTVVTPFQRTPSSSIYNSSFRMTGFRERYCHIAIRRSNTFAVLFSRNILDGKVWACRIEDSILRFSCPNVAGIFNLYKAHRLAYLLKDSTVQTKILLFEGMAVADPSLPGYGGCKDRRSRTC
jgi:hypothetical protein